MRLVLLVVASLFTLALPVRADLLAEGKICALETKDDKARFAACTKMIKSPQLSAEHRAGALAYRSIVYSKQGKYESALRDVTEAIRLYPTHIIAYTARCNLNVYKGEYEAALADCTRAHEINGKSASPLGGRAAAYYFLGDYQRSIAEASASIKLKPDTSSTYRIRGRAYAATGDFDRAWQDSQKSLALDPSAAGAYVNMGIIHMKRAETAQAIATFSKAAALSPENPEAFAFLSEIYLQTGRRDEAASVARQVLALPAHNPLARDAQIRAAERLTKLSLQPSSMRPNPTSAPTPAAAPLSPPLANAGVQGQRVALVLGNSNYVNAGQLKNPSNDAHLIAATLRKIGFTDVKELYDLTLPQLVAALKEFGDRASHSDWAVIYYAGHGMEMGGIAYLLPVDVKLEKDTHVQDETVSVDRVLEKVEGARWLKLVILDACRNNPFVARMVRSGTASRAISGGLPALEPEGNVLVAYATKHGTTASDGEGENGPYALALAEHIPSPALDVRVMFGRVRDTVRRMTKSQQDPYTYGSIGGDLQYFAQATQ